MGRLDCTKTHLPGPIRTRFAPLASALTLVGALALGGCVENAGEMTASVGEQQFVRRADASIGAATLAVMSIQGAPSALTDAFRQSLDQAAAARQIAVAPPTSAKYLVRGYLTASPIENGARIDFVWDVFARDKRRVQRLSDAIAVRGTGEDPWAMVSSAALDSIAGKCADDLAA